MAKTNLQQLALCELNLTNLQFTTLNEIAERIRRDEDDYFSYEDTLSDEEDKYLRAWLRNEGIIILKDGGILLRGKMAREWVSKHGEVAL